MLILFKSGSNRKPSPEIMTIEEVADYLRVPVSSLYKLAQQGKIPASKVGRHWRFRREFINRWIDDQAHGIKPDRLLTKDT